MTGEPVSLVVSSVPSWELFRELDDPRNFDDESGLTQTDWLRTADGALLDCDWYDNL